MSTNHPVFSSTAAEPLARATGLQSQDPAERAITAVHGLIRTIAHDPTASGRIALADTTVSVKLSDGPGHVFTLYLDREPIEMADHDDRAEITLAMTAIQLEQLIRGELRLAMEIAHGRIAYDGPVRKFLRVVPIIRRISNDWLAGPDHDPVPNVPVAH
jgi:putative sterol carrier protein